jgi:soluble lytic murein transglycosylase-like protein
MTAMLFLGSPAAAGPMNRWHGPVAEASARFAIPEEWIRRVIRAESGGRTWLGGRPTVSRAGAMGLMQLMPGTWREMRAVHGLGHDPHDPRDNILAGTAYLRAMYDRFGYPGLFAAYNAGPARYADHLSTGRPLPPETVAYAALLGPAAPAASRAPVGGSAGGGIFVALGGFERSVMPAAQPGSASLFMLRSGPPRLPE